MNIWQYDQLYHHGIKGMKWGVRRKRDTKSSRSRARNQDGSLSAAGSKKQQKKQQKEIQKFQENVNRNWTKPYNRATDQFNESLKAINKKYENDHFNGDFSSKRGQQYVKEVSSTWQKAYSKALIEDFGPDPVSRGEDWVKNAPFMDMYDEFINKK